MCQNWTEIGSWKKLRIRKLILWKRNWSSWKAALRAVAAFQWEWEVGKPHSQWISTSLWGAPWLWGAPMDAKIPGASHSHPSGNHKWQISPNYLCCLKSWSFPSKPLPLPRPFPASTKELQFPTHCLPMLPKAKEWKVLQVTFLGKTFFPFSATALLKAR